MDWVQTFLAVVDRGGFTAASAHVHRSQSRVSSHIASLERDLGVQLIDRSRRPAVLTPAGETFVPHARTMIAELAGARSSLDALQAAGGNSVTIVTEPGIGTAILPDLLAQLLLRRPGTRVTLAETGWPAGDAAIELSPGIAVAVLPRRARPLPIGLRERVLWREPVKVVVPGDHELARRRRAVPPDRLGQQRLIVNSQVGSDAGPLPGPGPGQAPAIVVGTPQLLVELVRRHVGIGLENAVPLHSVDTRGTVLLDLERAEQGREVALYWFDPLLTTELGRALHQSVMRMPVPVGADGTPGSAPARLSRGDQHQDARTAEQAYIPVHLLAERLS